MVMKRRIPLLLLFAFCTSSALAQDHPSAVSSSGGCGPDEAQFDVSTNKKDHPVAQAEAGKALVYVIEDIERGPTMRVGLDGSWVGANKGKSYFSFQVDPGDHQICTKWQSSVFKKTAERIGSAAPLTAEAGKVYYFRIQVYERSERDHTVKIEPVEAAEGQFLVSSSSFSTFRPKK
jgi:alpha-galactosidase